MAEKMKRLNPSQAPVSQWHQTDRIRYNPGYEKTWSWSFGIDETTRKSFALLPSKLDASNPCFEAWEKKSNNKETLLTMEELPTKLDIVGEVSEDHKNSLKQKKSDDGDNIISGA
ncbi:hypothetical protein Fmac_001377 [Flemingia macrophylla]|uniref:Uncharacterized protein n=1 Tax=Flemingia macrophylla TaxID=520843 RepID=A0ABD1NGX8_9FABA